MYRIFSIAVERYNKFGFELGVGNVFAGFSFCLKSFEFFKFSNGFATSKDGKKKSNNNNNNN